MAYNILKGTVEFSDGTGSLEGMVELVGNQTISGGKTFTQRLTASAITLNGVNLVPPAITAIATDGANRVITSDNDGTVTAQPNVTITNNSLTASYFSGSGIGLTNLQAQEIINKLSASQVNISNGLVASGFNITVSASDGLSVDAAGVKVDLMASHGLVFSGSSRELAIDPSNPAAITDGGQTLADADSFVVYDQSRAQTRKATAINIYSYISSKLTAPAITSYTNAGDNRIVTSVNSNTVNAEANLTFDGTDLLIAGNISGSGTAQIGGNLTSSNIVPNVTLTNNLGSLDLEWSRLYVEEVIGDIQGAIRFDAINDEGDSISRGQVVYIKGVTGQTPTVALAAADDATKMPAFGLAGSNAAQGASVEVITFGSIGNLNLGTLFPDETFAEGDPVFVQTGSGGVSGSMTTTRPTGSNNLLQNIGQVVRNGGGGDSQIKVGGAGRSNATPNLDKGYLFVGNDGDCSVQDNTIFISSSQNRVGINTTTPRATLDINGNTVITGSLEISGSGTNLLRLHKGEADTREIEIYSNGSRQSAISLNGTEQLFIENESTKDIVLRTNNQNTLRVFGQNQRVGIAKEGTSANAELDVDGAAIISGSFTVSGASTFGTIPSHVTQFVGHVSASAGMHISGTMPKLAIGSNSPAATNEGMLTIRPDDTNNRVLMMVQRTETSDNRIILAATGSGQVIVGGPHLDAVLNVSGSDIEKLISLKSDSENPAFYVSGSGDAALSGRLALNSDGTTDPPLLLNHAHIYSKLETGTAEMFVRDSDGNVTKISPHNSGGEWEYFSRNTRTGKVVRVNMERMIRKLEEFTGESFMEEWYEDPTD